MNKQTAVEWLAEVVAEMGYVSTVILEQAKEMEKQQIIDAYEIAYSNGYCDYGNESEQYYNETFKNKSNE